MAPQTIGSKITKKKKIDPFEYVTNDPLHFILLFILHRILKISLFIVSRRA